MALQFTRDVRVILENPADDVRWEIPVLDGFSFSQAINASEITVNEAGFTSRRARLLFNDQLAPVEWSFSTYARPTLETGTSPDQVRCVEEALWAMWAGADTFNDATSVFSNAALSPDVPVNALAAGTNTFNFNGSNVSSLAAGWDIYFQFEPTGGTAQVYKVTDAVINSVTMDFDIDGIATLQWSGFGQGITDNTSTVVEPTENGAGEIDLSLTSNFIRNRLSTVDIVRTDTSPDDTYTVVLTGGSITFENNITYLTPEELGKVNEPIANITGSRAISGNLTCYLDTGAGKSAALFNDLVSDTTTVRNTVDMAVNIGGTSTPSVSFDMQYAHLEIPVINVEDLLTLDITFHGQPQNGDVDNTNEATIVYRA
jgi:hypothetical protein